MNVEIVLCGGPYNGSSISVGKVSDVEVLSDLETRTIDVYRRDQDSLAYYWDAKLSELYTKRYDEVYASLTDKSRPIMPEEQSNA